MSKKYWIVAIIVSALACASAIGYAIYLSAGHYRSAQIRSGANRDYVIRSMWGHCSASDDSKFNECIDKAVNDVREFERSEEEAAAQKVSALWTGIAGGSALAGFIASLIGVIFVWQTFKQTKEQTRAAVQSHALASRPRFAFSAAHITVRKGTALSGQVLVENIGGAVAQIEFGSIGFAVLQTLPSRNPIDDFNGENLPPQTWTQEFGLRPDWWDVTWKALSDTQYSKVINGSSKLYMIGRLGFTFKGLDSPPQIHALFAFRYDPKKHEWHPVDNQHYFRGGL